MAEKAWAIGVDLGGTKIEVAAVGADGTVLQRDRFPTDVKGGAKAIEEAIRKAALQLKAKFPGALQGIGIGVAGQIEPKSGAVIFAPNLGWHNVPLQGDLSAACDTKVVVVNDVRAAAFGEWLFGAGKDCDDLICLFIGTGIGSGIVSEGRMLSGCSGSAGEVGHMIIEMDGPPCKCGSFGCLEAFAGGANIARKAQEVVAEEPDAGKALLSRAGGKLEAITAREVIDAYRAKDPLAEQLIEGVVEALAAGITSLVNAFNPCRIIMGGGIIEGFPEIIPLIEEEVRGRALKAALSHLDIVRAKLGGDAGVVGAASLLFKRK